MKKIFLIIILSLILTGCGKHRIGTYNYDIGIAYSYYLKLYNDGICEWKFGDNERLSKTAEGECSYNYTDNEIIIKQKHMCIITKNQKCIIVHIKEIPLIVIQEENIQNKTRLFDLI